MQLLGIRKGTHETSTTVGVLVRNVQGNSVKTDHCVCRSTVRNAQGEPVKINHCRCNCHKHTREMKINHCRCNGKKYARELTKDPPLLVQLSEVHKGTHKKSTAAGANVTNTQ